MAIFIPEVPDEFDLDVHLTPPAQRLRHGRRMEEGDGDGDGEEQGVFSLFGATCEDTCEGSCGGPCNNPPMTANYVMTCGTCSEDLCEGQDTGPVNTCASCEGATCHGDTCLDATCHEGSCGCG